ncbi:MAG TPA: hypothetical protein VGK73_09815 [Polyangiaceae bacterium]
MLCAFDRNRSLRTCARATLVALALSAPRLASAQDSQAENVAAARSLGRQGVQLAEAGQCKEAIEKLSRAESLFHAPTILGRLGECQVNVGQIVLGTENLNRVVREQLAPNAPAAFRDAQERAKGVLAAALPRIGRLTVEVEPKDAQATVTVSGTPVPQALIGVERPTDPGTHEVVASAPGYLPAKASVELAEGGIQTVALKLERDPNAAVTPPPPPPPPPGPHDTRPPPKGEHASSGNKTLAYVLLGVGGAGIVTGSITGVLALGKKSDLDCPNKECSGAAADDLDTANTMATISTIGFGVGLASAAVGTVLLIVGSGGSEKTGQKSEPKRFAATPYVGVGTAGVNGTFW